MKYERMTHYLDEKKTMLVMPQRKERINQYIYRLAELEDKIESGELLYANENARKEMREIIRKIGELSANKEIVELYRELCEKYGADVE